MPASPANVITNLLLRDAFERVVESIDANAAPLEERIDSDFYSDLVPQCRKPGIVHLQNQTCASDGTVLHRQCIGKSEEELLLRLVEAIAAINLQTGRSGGRKKQIGSTDIRTGLL